MKPLILIQSIAGALFFALALPSSGQPLSESVHFYFSDAGGSDERLLTDVVTSADWTKNYDIHVKNVWHSPIEFTSAVLVVGYAVTNGFGPNATMIPFSDLVSIRFPEEAAAQYSVNPNIPAYASWLVEQPTQPPFLGGGSGPPSGQPRPFGIVMPMNPSPGTLLTLDVGEVMFMARLSFKNRFLFQLGGESVLSVYSGNGALIGSSALLDLRDPNNHKSYRTANWEQNSTLRLTPVPEPATWLICVGGLGFALKGRRSNG